MKSARVAQFSLRSGGRPRRDSDRLLELVRCVWCGARACRAAAGCWKLLADHTAVERERQTQATRIASLEAEVAAAEAHAREADMRLQ